MSTKAKVLVKGSILRGFFFFSNTLIAFFLMPFIIHSLGDRMYGLWAIVGSFLGYYWMMDFGVSSAVERYMSRAVGREDSEETNIITNTALFLYALGGLLAFVISGVIIVLVPFFVKDAGDSTVFRQIFFILGLSFAFNFPMKIFTGVLRAHLRFDQITVVDILGLFARLGLILYFLGHGSGVVALAVITFAVDIVKKIAFFILAKASQPGLKISRHLIHRSKIKELFSYGGFAFASQIANQLRFQIDNFVIAAFLGLSFVTIYTVGARLTAYFRGFMVTALGLAMPIFSQYEGQGDFKSIREKFIFISKINGYVAMLIGATLIIFGRPLIHRWMGVEYDQSYTILLVFTIATIISEMQSATPGVLWGISKHKFSATVDICEGVANFILSIIFIQKFGLIGVALGTAIPMIITNAVIFPWYTCKAIELDYWTYIWECILNVFLRSGLVLGGLYLCYRGWIEPQYPSLIILSGIQAAVFLVLVYLFGFKDHEIRLFQKAVKLPHPFLNRLNTEAGHRGTSER